jgi:hypothetical protein
MVVGRHTQQRTCNRFTEKRKSLCLGTMKHTVQVEIKSMNNCVRQAVTSASARFTFKVKGQAVLVQAWTGPEGSTRLRLSDFKTIST